MLTLLLMLLLLLLEVHNRGLLFLLERLHRDRRSLRGPNPCCR